MSAREQKIRVRLDTAQRRSDPYAHAAEDLTFLLGEIHRLRDAIAAPDGWGFCSNRACPCWHVDGTACEEFCDVAHRHGRCARCGMLADAHPVVRGGLPEPTKGPQR